MGDYGAYAHQQLVAMTADRDRLAARVRVLEEALRWVRNEASGMDELPPENVAFRDGYANIIERIDCAALGAVAAPMTEEKR